jgi:hypothetical protein
MIQEQNIWRCI